MGARSRCIAVTGAVLLLLVGAGCGESSSDGSSGDQPSVEATPSEEQGPSTDSGDAVGVTYEDGSSLCTVLGPGDFAAVGIEGASTPQENNESDVAVYCVYAGVSGATGGIEFDAFLDETTAGAEQTFETVVGEIGAADATEPSVPKVDEGILLPGEDGDPAAVIVRSGRLVFAITVPAGDGVTDALEELAALVLERVPDRD